MLEKVILGSCNYRLTTHVVQPDSRHSGLLPKRSQTTSVCLVLRGSLPHQSLVSCPLTKRPPLPIETYCHLLPPTITLIFTQPHSNISCSTFLGLGLLAVHQQGIYEGSCCCSSYAFVHGRLLALYLRHACPTPTPSTITVRSR